MSLPIRRAAFTALPLLVAASLGAGRAAPAAADQVVKVGIDVPLTGYEARAAEVIKDGALLAFEQANAARAVPDTTIEVLTLDDSTSTAGGFDPAQAATNARKMVFDGQVVAAIGPVDSGAAKAMTPILSQGGLPTITPSATNPDLTDPKFASQCRPAGKPIFFRTVTTNTYQGAGVANYFAEFLKVKSAFVLDDGGAYGIANADGFQAQAEKKGIKLLGRDRLDEKASDYTVALTKIKQLNPDGIYYGGLALAGVKVVKQVYEIIPSAIKGSGDGIAGVDALSGAGFPAMEGWYVSLASRNLMISEQAQDLIKRFQKTFGMQPETYSITAYDGALVIIDAMQRLVAAGTPITREAMRDAIQTAKVDTAQGLVSFDENGDLHDRTVSLYQWKRDPAHSLNEVIYQRIYIGVAPSS